MRTQLSVSFRGKCQCGKKKPKKKTVSGMYIITYHQWEHNVQSECMYHQWDHADQTKNYLAAKTCKCKFIQQ